MTINKLKMEGLVWYILHTHYKSKKQIKTFIQFIVQPANTMPLSTHKTKVTDIHNLNEFKAIEGELNPRNWILQLN